MIDYIIIAILAVVVTAIICYIVRAKKRGQACIGCPYAKQCDGKCHCGKDEDKADL